MGAHSASYEARLASPDWHRRRERRKQETRGRCEWCGWLADRVELHHKTYERLGHELEADLELLCPDCHKKADALRAEETAERVWASRVQGWAAKRYGEDWEDYLDPADLEGEFESWLGDDV